MSIIDSNLFVGDCPFRTIPSNVEDLKRLREEAGLERAVATSFGSLFYYNPMSGLERDLERYEPLFDWLSFFAVVNPDFPELEGQIERAARDERIVGIRLFPTLHHYALDSERVRVTLRLAAEHHLPVNLTARLTDGRMAPRYVDQGELSPDALVKLLDGARDTTLILSMFFFNELQPLPVDWSRLPRVVFDLGCSKPSVDSFDRLPSWFPVERVLFGSGAPLYYWKGSRLAVEGARLPEDQKSAILGRTAKEVFGGLRIADCGLRIGGGRAGSNPSSIGHLESGSVRDIRNGGLRIATEKKDRPASGIRNPKLGEELRRFRIVDAHVHNWGLFGDTDYLAECLDRFGLHAVVLLSDLRGDGTPDPAQIEASNEATARVRDRIGDRIIPFCYVNAMHTDHAVEQVDRWDAEGFRGLKLWISEHATDPRTYTVVEAALEKNWPIYYHSYYRPHGIPPHSESPPMEVAQLARRYPRGRFIMAHMGAQFEHGLSAVADCPNLSVDYAGTVNEKGAYETALRLLGPDRIVFGTDMPACFYTNAGRVLELETSDAVKQRIFADNFLRLLGDPIAALECGGSAAAFEDASLACVRQV